MKPKSESEIKKSISKDIVLEKNAFTSFIHAANNFIAKRKSVDFIAVNTTKNRVKKGSVILCLTEDSIYDKNRLALRNCIIEPKGKESFIEIGNFTDKQVKVKKGTILGIYERIKEKQIRGYDVEEEPQEEVSTANSKQTNSIAINNEKENVLKDKNGIEYKKMRLFKGKVNIECHLTQEQESELKNVEML